MADAATFCTKAELAALTSMFKSAATAASFCERLAVAGTPGKGSLDNGAAMYCVTNRQASNALSHPDIQMSPCAVTPVCTFRPPALKIGCLDGRCESSVTPAVLAAG